MTDSMEQIFDALCTIFVVSMVAGIGWNIGMKIIIG